MFNLILLTEWPRLLPLL